MSRALEILMNSHLSLKINHEQILIEFITIIMVVLNTCFFPYHTSSQKHSLFILTLLLQ